ncbi:response regulator [Novosphingobium tardum]|uniref:Response regulator n=1 Tax=Novosphingobium tardum TaxID=1538021 RepID=A0ABV8RTA4_9SPHN
MSITGLDILVVEDEPVIALALEDLLIDGGALPTYASTLGQAADLLETHTPDAAILDVNVHGQTSYELAANLRERAVPFVFATGYGAATHPAEFAEVPTIAKPYNLGEIERAIAQARVAGHSVKGCH